MNNNAMADHLNMDMLRATEAANEKSAKSGREKVAEHKRVDDLRMTYEGAVKMYEQQREALKAVKTLLDLYPDNPELKRIQAETAQRMQVMYETMIDRKMAHLQAETDMLGPEVRPLLDEDELYRATKGILQGHAMLVGDPGIKRMEDILGHHPDHDDASRIKQDIKRARAKRLNEALQKRDYLIAVIGERNKQIGSPAESIGSAEMRAAMDARIAAEPQQDLLEELTEEVWRRENEDVLKKQYRESSAALTDTKAAKQKILDYKQEQFALRNQQALAAVRQGIE